VAAIKPGGKAQLGRKEKQARQADEEGSDAQLLSPSLLE
jgi:hypothetical protein